ncbi:MAG: hypothetical protein COT18_09395 [Elusimicrobia bacterium CG08_land_8_20_14_0_20_59_10]|nr:MAG: hypothetical protein COT18_09395 [Elusimicrobia bacterium CG08_land_8_20_14_0_20_59_10]
MNSRTLRLKELVDSILEDCVSGRVGVRGEAWALRYGEKRAAGALWPPAAEEGGRLTPYNFLAFADRCLCEILWEYNLENMREGRFSGPLAGWLAGRCRYREKIYKKIKARGAATKNMMWLLSASTVDRLVLLLTHSCQLRCDYCTVAKYKADIAPPVMKKACDLLLASGKDKLQLQFFGGEPLLRFGLLRRACDYLEPRAARAGKTVGLGVTTNGLALDAEKLDFFEERGVSLEVSCDGRRGEHLAGRKSLSGNSVRDYERLITNLELLRKREIEYKVIMVVTPESLGRMRRNYEYLAGAGHRSIQVNYALGSFWGQREAGKFLAELAVLNRSSRKRFGTGLVNSRLVRREPVALNSELSCDCDGVLYRETGLCIERDFAAMKERFRAGSVFNWKPDLCTLGNTQFDNFYMLTMAYARSKELMKLVMNNVGFGRRLMGLRS